MNKHFKRLSIAFISIFLMGIIIAQTTKPQEKEYTLDGTLQESQILLSHPDDISKNVRDKVVAKFVTQLNQQITDTIPKKK